MKVKEIIIFLLLLAPLRVAAQFITGTITDKEHGEPIPGVYVYFANNKNTMVVSDVNGRYKIVARRGDLFFSAMGFDEHAVSIKNAKTQKIDVVLKETTHSLNEVEIVRKRQKYNRKENPAVELMRKVIDAKKSSDLYARDYFSYQKYEKMTLALNEFTEKVFEDNHFKHFPSLREHVETCPETGKFILPLTVEEKVSNQIYRKSPRAEKTIVIGEHNDGVTDILNTGELINGMMAECFQDVNIYEDNVRLFQYPFISPISSGEGAIRFYRYFLADTLYLKSEKCYKVDFTPNNSQDFGFSGSLYVLADSTWRVRRVQLSVPAKTDVNFIEHLDVLQQVALHVKGIGRRGCPCPCPKFHG